jgi:hypothetical protein
MRSFGKKYPLKRLSLGWSFLTNPMICSFQEPAAEVDMMENPDRFTGIRHY